MNSCSGRWFAQPKQNAPIRGSAYYDEALQATAHGTMTDWANEQDKSARVIRQKYAR